MDIGLANFLFAPKTFADPADAANAQLGRFAGEWRFARITHDPACNQVGAPTRFLGILLAFVFAGALADFGQAHGTAIERRGSDQKVLEPGSDLNISRPKK